MVDGCHCGLVIHGRWMSLWTGDTVDGQHSRWMSLWTGDTW